ncbi:MAG: class IIb bacteriocin, lactobin A/cerein 7B family [Bacteroidales bacterium]|nr:class IIb bacteriocin, lactobin A/cerein 7B family [Bacteroidales bacterium]
MNHQEMMETNGGVAPAVVAIIKVGKWALRIGGALSSAAALVHCAQGCSSGFEKEFNQE